VGRFSPPAGRNDGRSEIFFFPIFVVNQSNISPPFHFFSAPSGWPASLLRGTSRLVVKRRPTSLSLLLIHLNHVSFCVAVVKTFLLLADSVFGKLPPAFFVSRKFPPLLPPFFFKDHHVLLPPWTSSPSFFHIVALGGRPLQCFIRPASVHVFLPSLILFFLLVHVVSFFCFLWQRRVSLRLPTAPVTLFLSLETCCSFDFPLPFFFLSPPPFVPRPG